MPPSNVFQNNNQNNPVVNPVLGNSQQLQNQPEINSNSQIPASPPSTPKYPKLKIKFSKPLMMIAGIVFALVVLIILIVKIFFGGSTKKSGEIVWWGLWEDQSVVTPLINSYESTHPGVKITYLNQSKEDYRERLKSALAKGEGPDIFTIHNSWIPMFKNELDALPSSLITAADYSKDFYPVITSDLSYGNSIVGIPLGYDALTLYINEEIFEKSGKSPPSTWDDLRKMAKELTIKDEKGIIVQSGVALGRTENVDHWQEILALMMIQNGVNLANPVGENAEDALKFFTLFSSTDGVWDATLPTSTQAFEAGKLAMYFAPSWRSFEIQAKNPQLRFKTVALPQLPDEGTGESINISYATYWAQSVWNKSTHKLEAWNFLKYLSSSDSLQTLYKNEAGTRSFGEPYPRIDMAGLLKDHPLIGSIVNMAPYARSWYLASRTFDGATGINTLMSNYFGDAVNAVTTGKKSPEDALETVALGVSQVLAQYGILQK